MKKIFDMHNHSLFSEDCDAPMELMIQRAIETGLMGIAITEHVDFNPADLGFMYFNEKDYSNEMKTIKEKYSDKIQIFKGAEFDAPHLYPEEFNRINSGDYDVILGAVHMIDDKFVGDKSLLENMSLNELFKKYYEQLLKLVQFGGFDVVAHFDFPKRYYQTSISHESLIDDILRTMVEQNLTLEINTSPLRKAYHESSPDYNIISKYASFGGKRITIGSDAHFPGDIGADFDYAFKLIQSIDGLIPGYFEKRKFKSV